MVDRVRAQVPKTLYFATLLFVVVGCYAPVYLITPPGPLHETVVGGRGSDKILIADITGVISEEEEEGLLVNRPGLLPTFKESLSRAAEDPNVKAVVLRINSPGGTVTASDILYHEVRKFRAASNKPVVAVIVDMGASGGYYVAAAADKIVAHPTSITGSIGVIMLTLNVQGLLEKIGVEGTTIKSGDKKDMGSPFRKMTAEEAAVFQGVIDQLYHRFVSVVVEGRKNLTADQVRAAADGRIYTGPQAFELGLVDRVGYIDDAIALAKQQAGLSQATIVIYHRPGRYANNIYSTSASSSVERIGMGNLDLRPLVKPDTPSFMYLWAP